MEKFLIPLLSCLSLFALPQNPVAISGKAECFLNQNELRIEAADRSIINWETFSISDLEKVSFLLPDSRASTLSRVIGSEPSSILGELSCNGKLFLINPAGVVFGPDSKVNTSSFIATTLNLSDSDFLDGVYHFEGDRSNEIVNLGTLIATEDLYLIAPKIEQNGGCFSSQGDVILASCQEAIVGGPDGKIRLIPKTVQTLQEEGIHCGGAIRAIEARFISDGSLSSLAINLDGIVDAENVSIHSDGPIELNMETESKTIDIKGSHIHISSDACIDLDHDDYGGSCSIDATESIVMEPTALISANAVYRGNGGNVRLFSKGLTHFEGCILAEGGYVEGDGGFVEVSGSHLAFKGTVSTNALYGKTGTLLLDPVDIAITNGVTANVTSSIMMMTDTMTPNNGSPCYPLLTGAILNFNDLILALGANNVVIDTVGTVGMCSGDIIFEDTAVVTYNSANSLTLSAANDIHFFSSVINNGTGSIFITAARDVNLIAIDTSIELTTNGGGAITISGVTRDLNVMGGALVGNYATVFAANGPLGITVGNNINVTGGAANGAYGRLQAQGNDLTIFNAATISVTGGSVNNAPADIFASTGGDAIITCQAMTVDTTASGASVTVSGDNDLILNVTAGDLQVLADAGGFAFVNASFELTATVANNITLTGNGGGFASMFGDRESATIQATNGSLTMNGLTQMYAGNLPNANLLVIAGNSIFANDTASFDLFSATGTLTLVVDNLFPTAPGVGSGQFVLSAGSTLNAGGNQLQVFTALPSQNSILGMLNGASFPLGANNEQFGVYYPSAFFVSDYVIFYKNPTLNGTVEELLVSILQPEFSDFAEFFRDLHPYSEYIYGSIRFNERFAAGYESYSSQNYRLRKKSLSQDWFELVYDPAKF